jgi:hypothetical protein
VNRDDFELAVICLLGANLIALFIVGSVLLDEIQRRPRVVGIFEGSRDQPPFRPAPDEMPPEKRQAE